MLKRLFELFELFELKKTMSAHRRRECPECGGLSATECNHECGTFICQARGCPRIGDSFYYDPMARHTVLGHNPNCNQLSYDSDTDETEYDQESSDEEEY